jgi:hypothetical protein
MKMGALSKGDGRHSGARVFARTRNPEVICLFDIPGSRFARPGMTAFVARGRPGNHTLRLPGLTRQSIAFERVLRKKMDARVKPAHDES